MSSYLCDRVVANPQIGFATIRKYGRVELPAFKLRRITNLLEAQLDEEFQLARLAEEADE